MKPPVLVAALVVLASGCPATPPPEASPTPARAPLATPMVQVAGCIERRDDVCVLMDGLGPPVLRLWIDIDPSRRLSVRVDGQTQSQDQGQSSEPRVADGGLALRLPLEPGVRTLTIDGAEPWTQPVELRVQWEHSPLSLTLVQWGMARGLPVDTTVAMLEGAAASEEGIARLAVLQLLRRVLTNAGRRAQAREVAEQAAALAREQGRARDLADVASALAYESIGARELEPARRWVDEIARQAEHVPEAVVWSDYYDGLLSITTGDLAHALRAMARAQRHAERLGMTEEFIGALEQHAVMLGELGRPDEARALIDRGLALVDDPSMSCAVRARARGNLGWAQLRLVQSGLEDELPWDAFEQALAAWERACPNPLEASNQRVNLALAALLAGDLEQAYGRVQQLRAGGLPGWLRPWVDEIDAQVTLASGRWSAAPSLLLEVPRTGTLGLDWSAAVRRASALARLGLHEAAIEGFAAAERMLDDATATVGIDVGREMFLAARSASATGLVDALLVVGRRREALCAARIARGRALRAVDRAARIAGLTGPARERWDQAASTLLAERARLQREQAEDWRHSEDQRQRRRARRQEQHASATAAFDEALVSVLSESGPMDCAQLSTLAPGDALLMVSSGDEHAWGLLADAEGIVARRSAMGVDPESENAWARAVLGPLESRLRSASSIRLSVDGGARGLPWPALPLGDGLLIDAAPLVHTLDLPDRSASAPDPALALIVADPQQDLPHAREEADAVQRSLVASGWSVTVHRGDEATRAAISASLQQASLVHYAGHGVHRGGDGWGAALLMHDGELGVLDLLALPRVPPAVVLAGCDTGTESAAAWAGGMNIGRAFVLAGARQVVVADGVIDDGLARRVAEAVAGRVASGPRVDLATALRAAQQRIRAEDSQSRWWQLQVLVP